MTPTKDLCLKFCDQLLAKDIILDDKILNVQVICDEGSKDVSINIFTEEVEYNFIANLIQCREEVLSTPEATDQILGISEKIEDLYIVVRDVFIKKYDRLEAETLNVSGIKSILKILAHKHANSIKQRYSNDQTTQSFKHPYNEILFKVIEVTEVEGIDPTVLEDGIELIITSSNYQNTENLVLVPSYSNENRLIFQHSDGSGKCKIVNRGPQLSFPLVYDVLLTIVQLSNQIEKLSHFNEITEYYYHTLEKNLLDLTLDISSVLPFEEYKKQIKCFLPLVKLDTAYNRCQKFLKCIMSRDESTNCNKKYEYSDLVKEAVSELYECILYPKLSIEDCFKIVKNKLGSSNYTIVTWSMLELKDRPGCLGDYFKLKIKINFNGEDKILNFFAKYLPTTSDTMKAMAEASFQKETFFYDTFVSELKLLNIEEVLDFLPKHYFSRSNDVLVFEDLALKNYKCLKKTEPMSYENIKFIIKQLVKLHACSILYEEKLSEKYRRTVRIDDKYRNYLKEVNLQIEDVNGNSKITISGIQAILNYIIDAFPEIPKRMSTETFKRRVPEAFDSLFRKIKKSDRFRNVICQGDFWSSNVMFKLKEDGTPDDCRIIDYQLIRYCPPTHDLFFLIYVNTEKAFRDKYMDELIEEYYLGLSKTVGKYNVDISKIYTYQEILECCEYMKPAAVCVACLYLPIILCPDEKIQDILSDDERAEIAFSVDRKEIIEGLYHEGPYRQRIKEIIEELYKVCEAGCF